MTDDSRERSTPAPHMHGEGRRLLALQKANHWRIARSTAEERVARLDHVREAIEARREEVYDAMWRDFHKHRAEVELTEIQPTLLELDEARRHLARWMRPRRVRTPLILTGTRSELQYEPRGVVLIMAPWNYPFNLVLAPLVAAVAAGNCVVVRPSEKVPHTAAVLTAIIEDVFDEHEVACVTEPGVDLANELIALPFDHIFFTGSGPVGRKVMAAAAANLATVTLELGGKSPLIVDETADVEAAAQRAVWGKYVNAGQTCIAPDHAVVHERVLPAFLEAAKRQIARFYGPTEEARQASPYFARIIDDAAFRRVSTLLSDAVAAGARVEIGGRVDAAERYIAPTIVTNVADDSPLMREEIFGPVLPVLTFQDIETVPAHVERIAKPLALYIFSRRRRNIALIRQRTSSGGAVVNNVLIHFGNPKLPFGGVGESGQGSYHGWFGFRTFSHERSVLHQTRLAPIHALFPPYTGTVEKAIRMAGRLFG